MSDMICHKDDLCIERSHPSYKGRAVLFDADGEKVWDFDASWTDEQIIAALAFANSTFARGVRWGEVKKAQEIKSALLIS